MADPILLRTVGGELLFFCPGCRCAHMIRVASPGPCWSFDGNMEAPTFSPSVLVRGTRPITDDEQQRIMAGEKITPEPTVCHLFIRGGKIEFLNDCTHNLKGQTVPMEPI